MREAENPYEIVARHTTAPRLAGYVSEKKLEELAGGHAVLATRLGEGTIVRIAGNPNFRAFWYGTSKLYLSAIFFGPIVKSTSAPETW